MINFLKRLFRKKEITYLYFIQYHDFFTGKTHIIKTESKRRLEKEYPKLYGGIINTVAIIFVYEE